MLLNTIDIRNKETYTLIKENIYERKADVIMDCIREKYGKPDINFLNFLMNTNLNEFDLKEDYDVILRGYFKS